MEHEEYLPRLQPSCSPDSSDSPTRWQKLRTVAQTTSLVPSDPVVCAALAGRHAAQMQNSALNHFTTVTKPRQKAQLLQYIVGSDRALLFEPDAEPSPCDSLETDLQVDAVLRKATARAVRLAGLPQAPPRHSRMLAGLVGASDAQPAMTAGRHQVIATVYFCISCILIKTLLPWSIATHAYHLAVVAACLYALCLSDVHHILALMQACNQAHRAAACIWLLMSVPATTLSQTTSLVQEPAVLRDRKNDMLLTAAPHGSPVSKPPHQCRLLPVANRTRPVLSSQRPQSRHAIDQHTRIKKAIAKQKLKRLSAVFASWRSTAHASLINLHGAARMLQWRKLLRVWKVPPLPSLLFKLCCRCADASVTTATHFALEPLLNLCLCCLYKLLLLALQSVILSGVQSKQCFKANVFELTIM